MQDTYTINGTKYIIEEFDPGWAWSSQKAESDDFYKTHNEALQAAMDYESQKLLDEEAAAEDEYNDRVYGTEQDQVRKTYKSMTGADL